jgi:hypothetical protein
MTYLKKSGHDGDGSSYNYGYMLFFLMFFLYCFLSIYLEDTSNEKYSNFYRNHEAMMLFFLFYTSFYLAFFLKWNCLHLLECTKGGANRGAICGKGGKAFNYSYVTIRVSMSSFTCWANIGDLVIPRMGRFMTLPSPKVFFHFHSCKEHKIYERRWWD